MQTNGCGCSSVPLPRVLARTTLMVLLLMSLPHRPPTPRHPDTWARQHLTNNQPQAEARSRCTASKIVWGDARKWKSSTRWRWPVVWHRGCGARGNTVTNARCWPVLYCTVLYCTVLYCAGLYLTTRRYQTRPSGHSHHPLSSARSSVAQ